jgi:CRISPR/Cas system-associated endonuclease Cas1
MFNYFNLSCDLMEPFRVLVDRKVKSIKITDFSSEEKYVLVNILNETVVINQTKQTVLNAIKYYCRSVFDALNEGDLSLIQFYSL